MRVDAAANGSSAGNIQGFERNGSLCQQGGSACIAKVISSVALSGPPGAGRAALGDRAMPGRVT